MGKKAATQPSAPDPIQVANAQGAANKDAAVTQAQLNRINQVTPTGSLNYETNYETPQQYTDANGTARYTVGGQEFGDLASAQHAATATPNYTAKTTLSPNEQAILDSQERASVGLSDLGNAQINRIGAAVSQPFNYNGIDAGGHAIDPSSFNPLTSNVDTDFASQRQHVEDAMFQRLNPQMDISRQKLLAEMSAKGITDPASQAYRDSIDELDRSQNDMRLGIVGQGSSEMQNLYNMSLANANLGNSARAQAVNEAGAVNNSADTERARQIQEAAYLRNQPLSEAASLLGTGSGPQMPQFQNVAPVNVQPADVAGATYASYGGQNQTYNTNTAANNATMGGLAGLGGAAIASAPFWR